MDVKLENHYGVDVFVSLQAEAARKAGCLCVHTENGETRIRVHLRKNIEYENGLKKDLASGAMTATSAGIAELSRLLMINRAREESNKLFVLTKGEPFADDGLCRLALINYAACVSGNLAMAVTRCPYYEPEKP